MTTDEKLAAILAAVQTDPGNRGLARDPHDNLFTATAGDFQAACRSIAFAQPLHAVIHTGFYIPGGDPPAFETDGPLGAVFLRRTFDHLAIKTMVLTDVPGPGNLFASIAVPPDMFYPLDNVPLTHLIYVEKAGPAADGRCYTMRGRDITEHHERFNKRFLPDGSERIQTIGIGDGGNEIGMGKVPHETVVKNIPNGDLVHCRVPTDHLIVAGVSNWGAYALAAGVYVLRGVRPPADLFDPDREREILEVMVREGPLVDGVTGKQTATVDGLTWDKYVRPLVRIRAILEA
jgi:D-glutamate cyclase